MLNRGPNPNSGTSAASNWLRRVWQAVQANKILPGVGYKVKYSSLGTTLEVNAAKGYGNAGLQMMAIETLADDYLVCHKTDGTTSSEETFNVAKPDALRGAAVHVVPPYEVGDIIMVAMADHTEVTVSSVALNMIDANVDGRAVGSEFHFRDASTCDEYVCYIPMTTPTLVET